jgi:hypothetical protein
LIGEPKIYYKVREIQTVTNPSLERSETHSK